MTAMAEAEQRRERQGRARLRAWRRSQMDCGDDACGECRVCRHYEHQEWVAAVAPRDIPCSVGCDPDVVAYLRSKQR